MAGANENSKQNIASPPVRPAAEAHGGVGADTAIATPARSSFIDLPLAVIQTSPRLRTVDRDAVANLAVAIEETGFFGAILVRPVPSEEGEAMYELVAGAHRLAAMRSLGRQTIPATIRSLTDDEAEQIEIDENLIRRDLTPLERAEMVLARFGVWARRFPARTVGCAEPEAPKRGRPTKSANFAQFPTMGFAASTAADIGLSRRTVENAWALVNGVSPDLRHRLRGTWIAKNDGILRQLAGMPDRDEQTRVVEQLLDHDVRNFGDARELANGRAPVKGPQTPVDETLKAFRALWAKATPGGQDAILHDLSGRPTKGRYRVVEVANG